MFCGQCGTKIDDEDRFCDNCGTERSTINNWDGLFKSAKKFSKQKHEQKILAKQAKEKQVKKEISKEKRQEKKHAPRTYLRRWPDFILPCLKAYRSESL